MSIGDALIREFVEGRYQFQGAPFNSPIKRIEISSTLDGREAELIHSIGMGHKSVAIVSDEITHDLLAARVVSALGPWATDIVLKHPHADEQNLATLADKSRHCDALIAVGSGTLNDLCKHTSYGDGRACAVFATSPAMNGYTTSTASITAHGYKQSLKSHAALGVFFDLQVLLAAPARMIRAGVGDTLCRSTAQVDWLLSHLIFNTPYFEQPYELQRHDEPILVAKSGDLLHGDEEAMAALIRLLVLGGLGVLLTGVSHSGSMGEHSLSHYIDMFAHPHPGSLHGEQVGVATMTMARLQELMLDDANPPHFQANLLDIDGMKRRYGLQAEDCIATARKKVLTPERADCLNHDIGERWPTIRQVLKSVMRPLSEINQAMQAVGAALAPADINLDPMFYGRAIRHAHEIRDRFSMLDLADHNGLLEEFAASEVRLA